MTDYILFFTNHEVVESDVQQFMIFKDEKNLKEYIFHIMCRRFMSTRFHDKKRHPDIKRFDGTLFKVFHSLPPLDDDEAAAEQVEVARERTNGEHLIFSLPFLLTVLKSIFEDESNVFLIQGKKIEAEEIDPPLAVIDQDD